MRKENVYVEERNADKELSEFFNKLLFHWPLFAVAILIGIAGAYVYLRYTKPVYLSKAKIYIKDEKRGGKELDALKELSFFGSSKVVENEMEIIKSPLILEEVIRKHGFNIHYYIKQRVATHEMYDLSPIHLNILSDSATVGNYFFELTILDKSRIKVGYTPADKGKPETSVVVSNGQEFRFGKDRFSLVYTPSPTVEAEKYYRIKVDSIIQLAYKKSAELNTALVNKQASVFEISYEDHVPKRSADFLNAVLDTYNDYTLADKNKIAVNTINFIETRLESLGGELSILERDVEQFKSTRGITDIEESSKLFLAQVKEADQKLNEANIQLSVYDQIEEYVSNPRQETPFAPVLGNIDQALVSLINRYEELLRERKRLLVSLQPENTIIASLDQQIADGRKSIKNYIAGYKRNALTARQGLQRQVNKIEGLITQVPGYERQFINLKRQQGVKEALYVYLLQKKEESAVSYASNILDNKVISPAYIPVSPVKPKRAMVLLSFVAGAVIVTSIAVFIKYASNKRVVSKSEIESILGLPVIADVFAHPDVKGARTIAKDRSLLTEQMLNLRTNLKFLLNKAGETPVILFTSSISGEGKTFLSANLGASLTYNNKKVVLLELDLRKPKLAKSLGVDNSSGFTNYVIGMEKLDDIIKPVPGTPGLYVVPSGPIPPNPVELLESEKTKHLFSVLKGQFDYILIDTSPVGLVSDAKSLAPEIDQAIYVVRFDVTPKSKLQEVKLNNNGSLLRKSAVIFNGIEQGSSYGYYTYGYGTNSYGYFDDHKESRIRKTAKLIRERML